MKSGRFQELIEQRLSKEEIAEIGREVKPGLEALRTFHKKYKKESVFLRL